MAFDPIAYINEPRWQHMSLGLDRMRMLLGLLGDPQDAFASVHVAGTNGKGSVCAYLARILEEAGYRTGLFTSPYVFEFAERIRVDGGNIPADALLRATVAVREAATAVEEVLGEHPTEFELMFAVACLHFAREGCDICVIECGLGGRLDATNVIEPVLCAITPIALDHRAILGDTIAAIACEKAGIIKPGVPVVAAPQTDEAQRVIADACKERGCALHQPDRSALVSAAVDLAQGMRPFSYEGVPYETRMLGEYQPENAALAIECIRVLDGVCGMPIPEEAVRTGIASAVWPGRFEVLGTEPLVVLDGGHNPHGAEALVRSLADVGATEGSVTFVASILADKDHGAVLDAIAPLASSLVAFTAESPRALDAAALACEARERGIEASVVPSAQAALEYAMQRKGPDGIVCAFGSLYSVGALKRAYEELVS